MTTIQLKDRLIGKINKIDDDKVLSEVNEVIDSFFLAGSLTLSDGHKVAIEEAILQIENGDFLTDEEANKEIEEWLCESFRIS